VGKPLGVFGSSYLVTRFTHAELSEDLTWRDIGGVGVLAGIGFTVSLLVSDLSFDDEAQVVAAKTAVLLASALAATIGGILLHHRDRSRAPIR
jgi:NhaA family Na+:H+ antiporter